MKITTFFLIANAFLIITILILKYQEKMPLRKNIEDDIQAENIIFETILKNAYISLMKAKKAILTSTFFLGAGLGLSTSFLVFQNQINPNIETTAIILKTITISMMIGSALYFQLICLRYKSLRDAAIDLIRKNKDTLEKSQKINEGIEKIQSIMAMYEKEQEKAYKYRDTFLSKMDIEELRKTKDLIEDILENKEEKKNFLH